MTSDIPHTCTEQEPKRRSRLQRLTIAITVVMAGLVAGTAVSVQLNSGENSGPPELHGTSSRETGLVDGLDLLNPDLSVAQGQYGSGVERSSAVDPRLNERVIIEDGFGNRRDDMTLGDVLEANSRLAEISEAEPGTTEIYGLLPSGEWGVIGVCVEKPMSQRSLDAQRSLTDFFGGRMPATFNDCGPAPGVVWPSSATG